MFESVPPSMYSYKNLLKRFLGTLSKPMIPGRFSKVSKLVLMYHRVLPTVPHPLSDPALYVLADVFEMHMVELGKRFEIVPLDELMQRIDERRSLCAITFDDGWIDNYDIAFPIMKKHKVPATIFICPQIMESLRSFWFDTLQEVAIRCDLDGTRRDFIDWFRRPTPNWKASSLTRESLVSLTHQLKSLPADSLDDLVAKAAAELGAANDVRNRTLNWGQAREMSQFGISFGSHGLNHYILNNVAPRVKSREVVESSEMIRGKKILYMPFFSYPNGSWDEETLNLVKLSGYKGAFTTRVGWLNQKDDPFLRNRIGIHDHIGKNPGLLWFRLLQAT